MRPDTNKSIHHLVFCSFTLLFFSQGIITKSHKTRFYPALQEKSNFWEGEKGRRLEMREKRQYISLTMAHWNQWMFDLSLEQSVLFTKICPHRKRIEQRTVWTQTATWQKMLFCSHLARNCITRSSLERMQLSEFKVSWVSAQGVQFYHLFVTEHKFGLALFTYGFLISGCLSMQEEYRFTCTRCARSILHLPFSFIRQLILTDSPLSVIWWQALFCLTSCWVAPLCARTVRIRLRALYLQPTLKSYSHSALSSVRSAWVGKGPEQNTLKYCAACFHYTLRTAQTLWTYFELLDVNF